MVDLQPVGDIADSPQPVAPISDWPSKEKRIFLIEDDNIDIMVFKRALKQLNIVHNLTIFSNGEEFLSFCEEEPTYPDILFLDLNTPRMNGLELLKVLLPKRQNQFFPIIVLSTSGDETDVKMAYDFMANGYITKSISFNVFVENIDIVLKYWDTVKLPKGVNNE